jgi:hypothetical protein
MIHAKLSQRLFAHHPFLGQASASRASLEIVTKRPLNRSGWCEQIIGGGFTFAWNQYKGTSQKG